MCARCQVTYCNIYTLSFVCLCAQMLEERFAQELAEQQRFYAGGDKGTVRAGPVPFSRVALPMQ